MMIKEFLFYVCVCASVSAFMLLLAVKWKVIEWMQVHGNDFFAKLANCDFCLSWWVCVILTAVWVAVTGDYTMVVAPFFATPITRVFL